MALPRLDHWLPDPAVRTHHRRASLVDPDELWRAALDVRLSDTLALGRLIRWRIPGTPPDQSFGRLFRGYPFTVLEERSAVDGLGPVRADMDPPARLPCARRRRRFPRLGRGAAPFVSCSPIGSSRSTRRQAELVTEARVAAGRRRRRSEAARAMDRGGAVRTAGGLRGAHCRGQAGGGVGGSWLRRPSSSPASGECASMMVRDPLAQAQRDAPGQQLPGAHLDVRRPRLGHRQRVREVAVGVALELERVPG